MPPTCLRSRSGALSAAGTSGKVGGRTRRRPIRRAGGAAAHAEGPRVVARFLARICKRRGELYEAMGDFKNAIQRYSDFIALGKRCGQVAAACGAGRTASGRQAAGQARLTERQPWSLSKSPSSASRSRAGTRCATGTCRSPLRYSSGLSFREYDSRSNTAIRAAMAASQTRTSFALCTLRLSRVRYTFSRSTRARTVSPATTGMT